MKNKKFKAFMCGIAWQSEMGETDVTIYPTEKYLEQREDCHKGCGIVEVEVKFVRWVKPQRLTEMTQSPKKSVQWKQSKKPVIKNRL